MNYFKYLLSGLLFGIVMRKAEIISWDRIYKMFRFDSFHVDGIIGSAAILGIIVLLGAKNMFSDSFAFNPKNRNIIRYLVGAAIFLLGWAIVGACPGPPFELFGHGCLSVFVVTLGALIGTLVSGREKTKAPR